MGICIYCGGKNCDGPIRERAVQGQPPIVGFTHLKCLAR